MKKLKWICFLPMMIFVHACATPGEATGLGAGAGAVLGGGVGAIANPGASGKGRIKNIVIGTAAGAALGAGAGYGAQKFIESRENGAFEKGKADGRRRLEEYSSPGEEPSLLPAKIEAVYVDDMVRGNLFIPAHVEYRIVEPARWQR